MVMAVEIRGLVLEKAHSQELYGPSLFLSCGTTVPEFLGG